MAKDAELEPLKDGKKEKGSDPQKKKDPPIKNDDDDNVSDKKKDDNGKPKSCASKTVSCTCGLILGTFRCVCFVCLPCINYCCCDTNKCYEFFHSISCKCLCFMIYDYAMAPIRGCLDLIELPDFSLPCLNNGVEDWGDGGSYDIRMIFWDLDGNLRIGNSLRDRDQEVLSVLMVDDSDPESGDEIWILLPSRWARRWVLFSHLRLTDVDPGPINLYNILVKDDGEPLGWRPNLNLKAPIADHPDPKIENQPGHYRLISLKAFQKLEELYGSKGYPIAVWGKPNHDKSRWRVFKSSKHVEKLANDYLPKPEFVIEKEAEEERLRKQKEAETKKQMANKENSIEKNPSRISKKIGKFFGR